MTLADSVLKTVKYFDVQDHALTLLEITKYLIRADQQEQPPKEQPHAQPAEGARVAQAADVADAWQILQCIEKELSCSLEQKHGFYFLKGRSGLALRRLQNNFYATARLKLAKKYLSLARHLPFISAVALTGSEAISSSKQGSDIDLLVLTTKHRMFLGRIFISVYFQVLGLRRHGSFIENRFCLNHYIQEGKILKSDQNLYTAVEYISLIPFFGADSIYDFQQKNIAWVKKYLAQPNIVKYKTPPPSRFKRFVERIFSNSFGDFLESVAGKLQYKKIKIQEYITVENDELSFHPGSKGQMVLAKFMSERNGAG